jgi:hypothetical protein
LPHTDDLAFLAWALIVFGIPFVATWASREEGADALWWAGVVAESLGLLMLVILAIVTAIGRRS